MAKDFSDVYEAIRAAEKEGRKEDVAKLVAYLETESAKPSEEDTYDPKNLVSSLTGSGVGAGSAVIGPAIIKKGVEAVKKTPAASSVTVSAAPGSALAGIDEATTKGLSNEVTQQTRTAQRAARTEEMSKIMAELKAKGIPVNPNLLAEVGTQVARPESGILLPVEEARKIATTEDAARVATAAANAPKTSMLSNAANFVKGITDYRIPFTNIQTGPILGRGLVGAGSGLQFADMLNRREMGDTTGAVISGIGGLGTAASLIPYLPARVVGGGVGMAAEAVNAYRDAMRRGDAGQVGPEYNGTMDTMGGMYAQGGLAHLAAGGSVMPNFNLDVKPIPTMTGQPGVGYMQTPAGAMMRLQMEKEMELARLRAGISGMGMAIPGQHGVKMAPGQMDVGANIPLGRGNLDISARRSINPIPGRGYDQGVNAQYTMPFAEGGTAKKPDANEGSAFIGYPQINKNRKVGSGTGFLDALVGAPASRTNILNPSDYSYMEGYEKGEPYGIAAMALPAIGMAKNAVQHAIPLKTLDLSKHQFLHGTSPEAKAAILESGKFDPHPARWPSYSYSEIGADTTYATPKQGWWLDKEKAASGRAAKYENAVGVDIDPAAKIAHIRNPKDWEKLAKKTGFKDGADMYRKLSAENLDSYNYAKNLTPEQFDQMAMERLQLQKWLDRDVKPGDFRYQPPEYWEEQIKEIPGSRERILNEQSILGPRAAVQKIRDKGYHGIYVDKHGNQDYTVSIPADEQLAIFDQSIIKPNPNTGYKKGGLATLNKKNK